jgi:hypothetical protein
VLPTEPIRPLKDVWLRPRRVFRDMSTQPIGVLDYALAAAQGIGNCLWLSRTAGAGNHHSVAEILGNSLLYGSVAGVVSLLLMMLIYRRLGARMGAKSTRSQLIHVLAYSSVPLAASLGIWVLTALLAGEAAFVETPHGGVDEFIDFLLHLQFICYVLLLIWSIVLQVMGLSEIQAFTTRKAFWFWVLGQVVGFLVSLPLALAIDVLFPGLLLRFIPPH